MRLSNEYLAALLCDMADFLRIFPDAGHPFLVYENAARRIRAHPVQLFDMAQRGESLTQLSAIGPSFERKILGILQSGTLSELEQMRKRFPSTLPHLLRIRGLGPSRVRLLFEKWKIASVEELKESIEKGLLRNFPGQGRKGGDALLTSIEEHLAHKGRFLRASAVMPARLLMQYVQRGPTISSAWIVGSLRRGKESIADIDLVVFSDRLEDSASYILDCPDVISAWRVDKERIALVTSSGIPADIRIFPGMNQGVVVHQATGSQRHRERFHDLLIERGTAISPDCSLESPGGVNHPKDESELFGLFGMQHIPPELREGWGEIEGALNHSLPELVREGDLKGDLHIHTSHTDGLDDIRGMALAARSLGRSYIAICDHTRNVTIANGMDEARIVSYLKEIEETASKTEGISILKGLEVDILKDGSLDVGDEILSQLDVVLVSVHSHFDMDRDSMTRRVCRALENRFVSILSHPTCRQIGVRSPIQLDMEAVFEVAARRGICLELNSTPDRLDLNEKHCRMARDAGVSVVISSDSHSADQLSNPESGVVQARRGWLERSDVLNTLPLTELLETLSERRSRR